MIRILYYRCMAVKRSLFIFILIASGGLLSGCGNTPAQYHDAADGERRGGIIRCRDVNCNNNNCFDAHCCPGCMDY